MSRKENIEKNMEFLIKELQKEWDVSKEIKHRVTISVKDARRVRIRVQQQIADMGIEMDAICTKFYNIKRWV